LAHPVRVRADVDDVTVVEHAIDQRGRHDFINEDLAPFLEALVRGEDRGRTLISTRDHLKEEHAARAGDRQIADLIDDQDCRMGEHFHPLSEPAGGLSFFERGNEVSEGAVVYAAAILGSGDGKTDGKMRFTDPGRTQENYVLLAFDEAKLLQAVDLLTPDAWLKAEIELGDLLHRGKSRGPHGGLESTVVAQADLSAEERLNRLTGGEGAPVDSVKDRVQRLQGARHLEIGKHGPHAISARERRALHAAPATSWE
jgi:hypothetical protein